MTMDDEFHTDEETQDAVSEKPQFGEEEPVEEDPAAGEPVEEEPVDEEPVDEEPAEADPVPGEEPTEGGGTETGLFVRREISSLADDDQTIPWYAFAVATMQGRADDDPTSWTYQAAIHASNAASPPPGANGCKHGTWLFLPWHRMYLLHFEEILRSIIVENEGPSDWALPYWNYGLGGEQATLPPAFRSERVDGQPNPLFVAERADGVNEGGQIPEEVASPDAALARDSFTGVAEFGGGMAGPAGPLIQGRTGRVEQTPHNDMHNVLGGGGWMSDPAMAALDPIFWLHHCNIDRLWDEWSNTGGHVSPSEAAWADIRFTLFDANQQTVEHSCDSVRDVTTLGYVYDTTQTRTEELAVPEPPQGPTPEPEMVGASEQSVQLTGGSARVAVAIDPRARQDSTLEVAKKRSVYLNVENVEADENPGSVYGIYVNLPDHADPEAVKEHHVGNISFFGIERAKDPQADEHGHGMKVSMEITDVVERLAAAGSWDEETLNVTFRPIRLIQPDATDEHARVEPAKAEPPVTVGRVSLFYG